MTLDEFVAREGADEKATITLEVGALPPNVLENLRKLQRLGLLTDEAVLCLVGQAPIDPYGIFGAMQAYGPWAFQPLDFTAVSILGKKGANPVALMRIDLLSNDLTFVALKKGQLVQHSVVTSDELMQRMATPGMDALKFAEWLREQMKSTLDAGMADQ